MKKTTFLISFLTFIFTITLSGQDLDKVLKAHFKAVGQKKINKCESMIIHGKILQMGMELPMTIYQKRPNKARIDAEFQGMTMIQAYDGENAWAVVPFTGNTEPKVLGEQESKDLKQMANMDGDFYKWEEKGHKLSLEGKEDMEGLPVYKLKLITKEGDEMIFYLDADSYLLLKTEITRNISGVDMKIVSTYSNYKEIEGITMAFSLESEMSGQVVSQIEFDSFEINAEVDDSLFIMPEAK